MKVVRASDPAGEILYRRVPARGELMDTELEVVVEDAQTAVVLADGRAVATYGPGSHGWVREADQQAGVAIVFVSLRPFDLLWGTATPLVFGDPETLEVRAHGRLGAAIESPEAWATELALAGCAEPLDAISACRRRVIEALAEVLSEALVATSRSGLPENEALAAAVRGRVQPGLSEWGLGLGASTMGLRIQPQ